jgi:ATP-dependent protease HslVU (ClpYQ) peptidase subunit
MTTIIGIQGEGWAVLATDSRIASFDAEGTAYQSSTLGVGMSKVTTNGKYLLGAAGDVRAINLIQHAFVPPTPSTNLRGKKLDGFITTKFIPALRACFDEHGYSTADGDRKTHQAEQNSTVVAVVNGTIYVVESDYSWASDQNGIYALGTGSAYALGAIHAYRNQRPIATIQNAKTLAIKALQVTARLDPYTGLPIQTFSQTAGKNKTAED